MKSTKKLDNPSSRQTTETDPSPMEFRPKDANPNLKEQSTFVGRLFKDLWLEVEPKNPLRRSFFISESFLSNFRYFTFIINTITFFWTIATTPNSYTPTYSKLLAFLTIWGFLFCYLYSIFVLIWKDVPDDSAKWKFVYLLGEIGFSLELMICPFYFIVIFPDLLVKLNLTPMDITYSILIHFIVPVLVWLEIIFSDIAFPKNHKIVLHIVIAAYLMNNLAWTVITQKPVYEQVDWVSAQSYFLKMFAVTTIIGGFSGGGILYRWKKSRQEKEVNQKQKGS